MTDPSTSADSLDSEIADALHARDCVALAKGLVMAQRHLIADAASRYLIDISGRTSRPLLRVCEALVATASENAYAAAPEVGPQAEDTA